MFLILDIHKILVFYVITVGDCRPVSSLSCEICNAMSINGFRTSWNSN